MLERESGDCLDKGSDQRSQTSRPAERAASERSRSRLPPSGKLPAATVVEEVEDLFEGEGIDNIVAEQAAINTHTHTADHATIVNSNHLQ